MNPINLANRLTFFTQMGILILATVISSLIYSLFFFVPLLYVVGPEHNFGNLKTIQHTIEMKLSTWWASPSSSRDPPQPSSSVSDDSKNNATSDNPDSNPDLSP